MDDRYTRAVATPGMPARVGWFITIEGPDGAGKTTQAERLAGALRDRGHDVLSTREPGGTWLGERIREVILARGHERDGSPAPIDPLTDALLFSAARRQLVEAVLRPALAAGRTVICARYVDSTIAYQGYGAGVPLEALRQLEAVATGGLLPDVTVLLDLPVEAGLSRKEPDDLTRFEEEFDVAFHRRVREGFRSIAAAEPDRFVVVDATAPEADVADSILEALVGEPKDARVRINP